MSRRWAGRVVQVATSRSATRQRAIGALFGVNQQTVHNVVKQIRPLLTLAGHDIVPAGTILRDAQAVTQHHTKPTTSA